MLEVDQVEARLKLELRKEIGSEGKNSRAWIAYDPQINQQLVVKVITTKSLDAQKVNNYFQESQMLNSTRHPHIMPILYAASSVENKEVYITMPYYSNGSINSLIDNRSLTVREVLRYSVDFLSGLLFMHIKGLLHLDVKPTNIIINDSGRAILTDFGLSRYLNENGVAFQPMTYTTHKSPESNHLTYKSIYDDIYQSGLTLYRMCNGNKDFKQQYQTLKIKNRNNINLIKEDIDHGNFPDRHKYKPHIPNQLRRIINKMINIDLDCRYDSVLKVINDLSKITDDIDWLFIEQKDGSYCWEKNDEKRIIKAYIRKNDNKFMTNATKFMMGSHRTNNINKLRKEFSTLHEAESFIHKNLKNI